MVLSSFGLFLGYALSLAYMYQDNKSTIYVCETGLSKSGKLKHMAMRYYFIRSHIAAGSILIEYTPTTEMIADILTKPFERGLFKKFRDKLLLF